MRIGRGPLNKEDVSKRESCLRGQRRCSAPLSRRANRQPYPLRDRPVMTCLKEVLQPLEKLVPPIRIERTTNGLGISDRGVAQVFDDMGNPLAITGDPQFFHSFCFSSLDRVSA